MVIEYFTPKAQIIARAAATQEALAEDGLACLHGAFA
jgi:hypothetical protein